MTKRSTAAKKTGAARAQPRKASEATTRATAKQKPARASARPTQPRTTARPTQPRTTAQPTATTATKPAAHRPLAKGASAERAKVLARLRELGAALPAGAERLPALELLRKARFRTNGFRSDEDWQLDHFRFERTVVRFPAEGEPEIDEELARGGHPTGPCLVVARSRFKIFLAVDDGRADFHPTLLSWDFEDPDLAPLSLLELLTLLTGPWKPAPG